MCAYSFFRNNCSETWRTCWKDNVMIITMNNNVMINLISLSFDFQKIYYCPRPVARVDWAAWARTRGSINFARIKNTWKKTCSIVFCPGGIIFCDNMCRPLGLWVCLCHWMLYDDATTYWFLHFVCGTYFTISSFRFVCNAIASSNNNPSTLSRLHHEKTLAGTNVTISLNNARHSIVEHVTSSLEHVMTSLEHVTLS